jgi:hypothetical protein
MGLPIDGEARSHSGSAIQTVKGAEIHVSVKISPSGIARISMMAREGLVLDGGQVASGWIKRRRFPSFSKSLQDFIRFVQS